MMTSYDAGLVLARKLGCFLNSSYICNIKSCAHCDYSTDTHEFREALKVASERLAGVVWDGNKVDWDKTAIKP